MTTRTDQLKSRLSVLPDADAPSALFAARAFDVDTWHAMQARDDQLIADAVLHGYAGQEYVYDFVIQGKKVQGVSVIGARALAAQYGGIQSRIVASVDKTGTLFVFKSFEPLAIQAQMIPQLADEEDFYEVVLEVKDIKTGNSMQVRKKEYKREKRRDGTWYDRPHYDVIAESKAHRNGVLSLIPQDVIKRFKDRALTTGHASHERTKDQLVTDCLTFAAKHRVAIDRRLLGALTYAEILGMGQAAKDGIEVFRAAADQLDVARRKDTPGDPAPADDQENGLTGKVVQDGDLGSTTPD